MVAKFSGHHPSVKRGVNYVRKWLLWGAGVRVVIYRFRCSILYNVGAPWRMTVKELTRAYDNGALCGEKTFLAYSSLRCEIYESWFVNIANSCNHMQKISMLFITTCAAREVLFSVLSVCVFVCLSGSVNKITHHQIFRASSSYGRKGGQVQNGLAT